MYNIHNVDVIDIQNTILMANVPDRSHKKQLVVITPNIEVMQVYNTLNLLEKYNWQLNPMDNEAAVDLEL